MQHFREFAPHGTTTKKRQITHGSFAPPVAQTTATAEREDPSLVNKPVIFPIRGAATHGYVRPELCVWCGKRCSFPNSRLQTRPKSRKEKTTDYSRVRGPHIIKSLAGAERKCVRILRTDDLLSQFGGQLLTVRGTKALLLTVPGRKLRAFGVAAATVSRFESFFAAVKM